MGGRGKSHASNQFFKEIQFHSIFHGDLNLVYGFFFVLVFVYIKRFVFVFWGRDDKKNQWCFGFFIIINTDWQWFFYNYWIICKSVVLAIVMCTERKNTQVLNKQSCGMNNLWMGNLPMNYPNCRYPIMSQ